MRENCSKYCWSYTQRAGPFFLNGKLDCIWVFRLSWAKGRLKVQGRMMTGRECLIPFDSQWFRSGRVTQFWLRRPTHKSTGALLRKKVFSLKNEVECRRRHDPLLCLWLFVAYRSCDHKELIPSALLPGLLFPSFVLSLCCPILILLLAVSP